MRMPHVNLSPVTLVETFGFYLLIRLQAVAELAHVLEFFTGVRQPMIDAIEAHKAAVMARRAAVAVRDHENDRMDQQIRILAFTILGVVNNNRSAPIFRHYFPQGFSEVLRTPVAEQRRRAVVLLEKLAAERDETVKSRLEPFREQLTAFESSLDGVEKALDEEARHRANREAAKMEWLDGYRKTHQMLQDHYSNDPRKADEFFRSARVSQSASDDDESDIESQLEDESDLVGQRGDQSESGLIDRTGDDLGNGGDAEAEEQVVANGPAATKAASSAGVGIVPATVRTRADGAMSLVRDDEEDYVV